MKWIESIPARTAMDKVIINFLEENIFSRFGCPRKLITDNAQEFKYSTIIEFYEIYNVTLAHFSSYYPQGNRFSESSNKSLIESSKKFWKITKKGGILH